MAAYTLHNTRKRHAVFAAVRKQKELTMSHGQREITLGILILAIFPLGCAAADGGDLAVDDPSGKADSWVIEQNPIRVANFNIQAFGEEKRSDPAVMDVLTTIARQFDVMAVEELRDASETTLPFYMERINAVAGPAYAAVWSPRLGRTQSKENYAFIYNTETIALVDGAAYTFEDPPPGSTTDLFQREPFIARFVATKGDFDFVLIVIHTEPDETWAELSALPLVLDDARGRFPDENDFIMLGDMNAGCSYLHPQQPLLLREAPFVWVVPDEADTTVKATNCAYDRIILDAGAGTRFTGTWGVFLFDAEYNLSYEDAVKVSDHYPVWAEFNIAS
jgi:endonuclease/exonuclease/phosphatase family metal-dependent hydrolase